MLRCPLLALLALTLPMQAQFFQPSGTVPLGVNTVHTLADFNLDGRPDLAVGAASSGKLTIFFGAANGTFFAAAADPTSIETPTALVPGDFDNDGKTDLALLTSALFSEPAVRVLLGSGSGTFTQRPALILANLVRAAAAGDFNKDGNLDLAIIAANPAGTNELTLLLGNGSGDLAPGFLSAPVALPVPSGSRVGDIQAVDLNGDKLTDLVMTVSHSSGVGLAVALGNSVGSFTATATMGNQPPLAGTTPGMAIANFTGDSKPEVVMFGYLRDQVTLWANSGGVLFPQTSASRSVGANPYDIAAADFDLDGFMDWAVGRAVASGTPELHLALGNGGTSFTTALASPFLYGGPNPTLETGDFNGDRRLDLLVLEGNEVNFRVLLNSVPRPPTLLPQEIQIDSIPDRNLTGGPLTLSATATSGLPVTFAGISNTVCTVSKGIVTMVDTGLCSLLAIQPGDFAYSAAPIVTVSFNVVRNLQTITFAALPDRALDASPFTLAATASSGLTVTFAASPASVCTVSGTAVTLVAVGQCSITASQPGNGTFPAAAPVTRTFAVTPIILLGPSITSISNAASYAPGTLSPASYGVLFGVRLNPNPSVKLRDSAGTQHTLELIFSGTTQINFIIPPAAALGAAAVIVSTSVGSAEFPVTIAATAPGLFSSAGTGQGPAAAQAVILNADKSVTNLIVADGAIPVRAGSEIYLVLYGTGIRGHTPTGVFVSVAGIPVDALYAGPQGTYPALDQVNVRVPLTVAGRGTVEIRLIVDGVVANIVTATFQ